MLKIKIALFAGFVAVAGALSPATAQEAHHNLVPEKQNWSFSGPFGTYDHAQLQRGYRVFREVCSNCHSMKFMAFRNLADKGGPEFSESQVKALAAEYKIKDGPNDAGEMYERAGRASDYFPWTFANPEAAKAANGGALPPDMSVLAKARSFHRCDWFPCDVSNALLDVVTQYQEHGPDYIVGLLNGYATPPAGEEIAPGLNYNLVMPGNKIAMAKPLSDGQVDYTDGTPKTAVQYSRDVAAFLMWAAEPKLEERKKTGFRAMVFLILFATLMWFVKRRVWADVAH